MEPQEIVLMREKLADHMQAEFYKSDAGLNEIWELYVVEHCLAEDEAEDAFRMFQLEHVVGIADNSGPTHKIVSDIAWKCAQNAPIWYLKDFIESEIH